MSSEDTDRVNANVEREDEVRTGMGDDSQWWSNFDITRSDSLITTQ